MIAYKSYSNGEFVSKLPYGLNSVFQYTLQLEESSFIIPALYSNCIEIFYPLIEFSVYVCLCNIKG